MSLKKNVIANFIGQGWTALMGLAFIPLYIKYLGIEAYGLIGFYAVMQAWLTLFDMGITQTLNREMARFNAGAHSAQSIHDLLRSLELISFGLAVLVFALVWSCSSYIATHWLNASILEPHQIQTAIILMGAVIALRFIEGIYKGALLGLQKQVLVNVINILMATMRYGGVVAVLAFYESNINVFFTWQAITSIITLILFLIFVYKTLPKPALTSKFSTKAIKEVWRFAGGMMGITFLAILLTQVDKLLLSKLISLESYGYYTLAATIAGGLALIAAPTTQAIYPKMVEYVAQNKQEELAHLFHQGAQLISVLITPIAMMLIFFGKDIIYLWSGDINLALKAAPILVPLALGSYFNGLMWMPYQLQLAHAWTNLTIKINFVAVCILIPTVYYITPKFGSLGVAWLWAILNGSYLIFGIFLMHKKILISEKWKWYGQDVLKQFFTTLVMIFIAKMLLGSVTLHNTEKIMSYAFVLSMATFFSALISNKINNYLHNFLRIFNN